MASKALRRNRMNRAFGQGMGKRYVGDSRKGTDWVIGNLGCDNSGANTPAFTWGDAAQAISAGQCFTWQAVSMLLSPAASVSPNPPKVGSVLITQIVGSIFLYNANLVGGLAEAAVCIYISKCGKLSNVWDIRLPSTTQDANRDDYLFLRKLFWYAPTVATLTMATSVEIPIALPEPVEISGGEALHITVDVGPMTSLAGITALAEFRSCFRSVA